MIRPSSHIKLWFCALLAAVVWFCGVLYWAYRPIKQKRETPEFGQFVYDPPSTFWDRWKRKG